MPRAQANSRKAIKSHRCSARPIAHLWQSSKTIGRGIHSIAVQSFATASIMNPNYAMAVAKYATSYLHPVGRFEEGEKWLKRALVLDPLSPLVHADFACNLAYRGLFYQFEQEAARVLEDDPAVVKLYWFLSKTSCFTRHKPVRRSCRTGPCFLP